MNRLLVALLAALDAVIAAAGGLALALAPLTLLWVFALGGGADLGLLWPAGAMLWQAGHLAPVTVTLPDAYLAQTGIDPAAAAFTLSLAPLVFAAFTAWFAARSGGRAARAGAPVIGVVAASLVFAAIAVVVAVTSTVPLASVEFWPAVLLPAAIFAVPCLIGAAVTGWGHDIPPLSALRQRVVALPGAWSAVPGLIVRGAGMTWAGLAGIGALCLAVVLLVRSGDVVALFQATNADAVGAIVIALGQLAYLPTLIVWALSFVAGPGFALGEGSAVSPAGTQLGVVPGIPVLGAVPESTTVWLLLLALLPVALGAFTGWVLRSRLVVEAGRFADDLMPRVAILVGVGLLAAGGAALAAVCASGAIGPGRLAVTGPDPGALALAVGVEVAVGAGILLLGPRRHDDAEAPAWSGAEDAVGALPAGESAEPVPHPVPVEVPSGDDGPAAPADDAPASPDASPDESPDAQPTVPITGVER